MFFITISYIINLTACFLYVYDKSVFRNFTWRVSENTLLLLGFAVGSLGVFYGYLLHQKFAIRNTYLLVCPV